eukprot:10040193-Lingulodinium_polyedra.AAC.1
MLSMYPLASALPWTPLVSSSTLPYFAYTITANAINTNANAVLVMFVIATKAKSKTSLLHRRRHS